MSSKQRQFSSVEPEVLLNHWRYLRQNDCFTDLKIYCGQTNEYVALHGAILAACSPFIASLLNPASDQNVIQLPDFDYKDVITFVNLLYGESMVDEEPSPDLIKALNIDSQCRLVGQKIKLVEGNDQLIGGYGDDVHVEDEVYRLDMSPKPSIEQENHFFFDDNNPDGDDCDFLRGKEERNVGTEEATKTLVKFCPIMKDCFVNLTNSKKAVEIHLRKVNHYSRKKRVKRQKRKLRSVSESSDDLPLKVKKRRRKPVARNMSSSNKHLMTSSSPCFQCVDDESQKSIDVHTAPSPDITAPLMNVLSDMNVPQNETILIPQYSANDCELSAKFDKFIESSNFRRNVDSSIKPVSDQETCPFWSDEDPVHTDWTESARWSDEMS